MKPTIWLLALLCPLLSMCQSITIRGTVINEEGAPVQGATILLKGTNRSTIADATGRFAIPGTSAKDSITVSAIGYQTITEPNNERGLITITLKRRYTLLDETVIIAYGTTTRRFNTGSVGKITAAEITAQPVFNPLATLYGRVPGLEITQNSGTPGAGFKIQLRGQSSLTQGTEPLFIIDGVPFLNGNAPLNQTSNSANGGLSPLNSINPARIESIEVLKDADATAIYGSRAANGVILITTKKAATGKLTVSASYKTGFSWATRTMNMLTTAQYLSMRREAFANDGIIPTTANAPDLLLWDTTCYTNFKQLFTGGRAVFNDAQVSFGAAVNGTRFLLSLSHQKETTVLEPGLNGRRYSVNLNLGHTGRDKRFSIASAMGYTQYNSNLLRTDLTSYINLAPHFRLYDSTGALNWKSGNAYFSSLGLTNPLAQLQRKYNGSFSTFLSNLTLAYKLGSGLTARVSNGFQQLNTYEQSIIPRSSLDPSTSQNASAEFSNATVQTLLTEPQLEYSNRLGSLNITVLTGASFQQTENRAGKVLGDNYTNDFLLSTPAAAGSVRVRDNYSLYRYAAVFTRVNLLWKETRILNLTARRDGSSRFGPARRFANFWAIGAAWIFSNEKWIKQRLPFISFGKLRASTGTTGNDQIGDYQYLNTWSTTSLTYQGTPAVQPSRLFNPAYSWEKNTKAEIGLELGFLKDRFLLFASAYRHINSNQLVNYSLPVQTGFTTVLQNFNARIENKGLEIALTSKNITGNNFEWTTVLNITVNRNKLLSFPNIEKTPYRSVFRVGHPLSTVAVYKFLGIDPATGIYRFLDVDNNGIMDLTDRISLANTTPAFYGGISNNLRFKNIELLIHWEFRKQVGKNYLATQGAFIPGYVYNNQPEIVLNRWQKPGDNKTAVQRYVAVSSSPAFSPAQSLLANSDAVYSDASFLRLRNMALTWKLNSKYTAKMKINEAAVFLQAQNLFTITRYTGADPENQNLYTMPPLRTVVVGFRIQL